MSVSLVAHKVVNECLRIREDEQVLVFTWDHTIELASALALEIHKVGASPFVTLEANSVHWGYLTDVPEKYYGKTPRVFLSALEHVDASIWIRGPEDPSRYETIPGERLAKVVELEKPVMDSVREKKIRSVSMMTGYVTPQRARAYGFNLKRWRRITNNAMSVDHTKMAELGRRLASKLDRANRVRLTGKGTDLTFDVTGRASHVFDGIIDDTDRSRGTISENLPSGVVAIAPVESSANGSIMFDQPRALRGKLVGGLKLTFENGMLRVMTASSNLEALETFYKGSSGDKGRIGSFTIGINPGSDFMGFPTDELVLGAVSVGLGANREIGGMNDTMFGHSQTLSKPTVEVDEVRIIDDGRLTI